MEDITLMTNINKNNKEIKFKNLFKSIFSDLENVDYTYKDNQISVFVIDQINSDSARVDLEMNNKTNKIIYWDGYSNAEIHIEQNELKALKKFKNYLKKLNRALTKYS